ncbi:MAG: NAD-dependent succinate-semialdehyde dehydrogenase [Polaromonas sp.]|uniref:NAD-dependent succinate-semialdehyde dehydrogenase n=1 Tax=Polaromonas sp. TaxID=1869339 RepID=UPI002733022D|nr:NAD-dependent succinate-semialdehyde dehydrogenase [Polaromonas sp.]MDP3799521.1 NAD-dependent succinate-semialdehyde dehydrogenase [Polaromonas sp.]
MTLKMIHSVNPATGETLASFPVHEDREIDRVLSAAATAQRSWRQKSVFERTGLLQSLARVLRARKAEFARLITQEMGKPLAEAAGEVEKCAVTCDYYASHAPAFLDDTLVASNATDSRVVYDPLGVVLAVMPWNYPFWQVLRGAAPAMVAGNAVVLKHAGNVPQCALALGSLFVEAGAPEGLFGVLLVESSAVKAVIADPRIAAVTFTGSTPVGRTIASQAGHALKKQVLELGGSDPFIVLADADVQAAAKAAVKARFQNSGQSCISAKRFIVEDSVADEFADALCALTAQLVVGDPMAPGTDIGPMARASLRDELHAQVEATVQQGAVLRVGGHALAQTGHYYAPTVLDHVGSAMVAAREETFGPVAAIIRVRDADEAVAVANSTEFGLGAALWTGDKVRAQQLSRQIEAGAVFVNGVVASDARLPFGGLKQSGYGRELGIHGLREFTNIKTVWTGPAL